MRFRTGRDAECIPRRASVCANLASRCGILEYHEGRAKALAE